MMLLLAAVHVLVPSQDAFVETRRMLSVLGPEVVFAAADGDVDGDGDGDLLVARQGADALLVNLGGGAFEETPGALPAGEVDESRAALLADLDGDGDLDAYLGNAGAFDKVYANDGAGVFSVASTAGGGGATIDAEVGDVDLDGDLDVVLTKGQPDAVHRLERNTGAGLVLLTDPLAFPPAPDEPLDAALGDLDGDGDLDVFSATEDVDPLYLNDGAGMFSPLLASPVSGISKGIGLGDLDGDGDIDAYVSSAAAPAGSVASFHDRVLVNDGSGSLSEAPRPPLWSDSVVLTDVDGDVDLDALALGPASLRVLANDGSAAFADVTAASVPIADDDAVALGVLDADGDLDPDLILFDWPTRLWLNARGRFAEAQSHPVNQEPHTSLGICAAGDLNGDGRPDVLSSIGLWINDPTLRLYLNDGFGLLAEAAGQLTPEPFGLLLSLDLADAEGDGDLDAFFSSDYGDHLYQNDGSGNLADVPGALPDGAGPASSSGMATGDLDGDGDLDLVASGVFSFFSSDLSLTVSLGNGAGTFAELPGAVSPGFQTLRDPTVTDIDADGDLDLVVPGVVGTEIHRNGGSAFFTSAPSSLPGTVFASAAAAGDLDGDGDPDLVLTDFGVPDQVLLNDGSGAFLAGPAVPSPELVGGDPVLMDVDADGDLDLLSGSPMGFFVNDGAASFSFAPGLLGDVGDHPSTADFDGDGDLDLAFNAVPGLSILTRVTGGQVAWRTLPRVGKPLRMEVFGAAPDAWTLAASFAPASISLPPFGTLLLNPARLVIVAAGSIPASGVAAIDVPIGGDPALVGLDVWWQALLGNPLAFTNADRTSLTKF